MEFNIKILNDEDFERIPSHEVGGADISESLGVANVNTGRIFVRNTGVPELNKYLIDHEIAHLFEDEVTDAEPGMPHIRHKKFRQAAGNIGAIALPIIGNAIAPGIGGVLGGAAGGALKGGIGGQEKSFSGALKGGAIGGATSAALGGLTGNFGTGGTKDIVTEGGRTISGQAAGNSFGQNLGNSFRNFFGAGRAAQNIGNFFKNPLEAFGGGTAEAASTATKANPQIGGGFSGVVGNPAGPGTVTGSAVPFTPAVSPGSGALASAGMAGKGLNPASQATKSGGSLMEAFGNPSGKQLLGAASLGAGLFSPLPKVPDISEQTAALRSQIENNPLMNQARGVLSNNLNREFQPLSDEEIMAATRQIDEAEKRAEDQIRDVYRNIRPGTDEFTDTALAKELEDNRVRFAQTRADTIAGRTRSAEDRFIGQQSNDVAQAIGASNQEVQQLAQLATLDIGQIMAQLGLDIQQAQLFKQTFMDIGTSLLFPQEQGIFEKFLASRGTP